MSGERRHFPYPQLWEREDEVTPSATYIYVLQLGATVARCPQCCQLVTLNEVKGA